MTNSELNNDHSYDRDLEIDIVLPDLMVQNRDDALMELSLESASLVKTPAEKIYETLKENEEKASSAIGGGVAIPVIKMPLNSENGTTILARTHTPVNFNANDNMDVDIICLLIAEKTSAPHHLRRLSRFARIFHNRKLCDLIRDTADPETIKSLIHNPDGWTMAA